MKSIRAVYVLHENGANSHFRALDFLLGENDIKLIYYEFSILRGVYKGVINKDVKLIRKQLVNLIFLINLVFCKRKQIVLGIAPFDYRLVILRRILFNHDVFYFTSWHKWDGSFYPKTKFSNFRFVTNNWRVFLEVQVKNIFSVTKMTKRQLLNNYKIKAPISIVHHSYNWKIGEKIDLKIKNREKNLCCLYVGRFEDEKGVNDIIALAKNNVNINFTFVGQGDLLNAINEAANKSSNVFNLNYISSQEKLFEIFKENDVLLLPSKKNGDWEELFGMVIIEAMRCGVVTIASNHAGPKEIIENYKNGFIVPEESFIEEVEIIFKGLKQLLPQMSVEAIRESKKYEDRVVKNNWTQILAYID